jgi:hypothetical protein
MKIGKRTKNRNIFVYILQQFCQHCQIAFTEKGRTYTFRHSVCYEIKGKCWCCLIFTVQYQTWFMGVLIPLYGPWENSQSEPPLYVKLIAGTEWVAVFSRYSSLYRFNVRMCSSFLTKITVYNLKWATLSVFFFTFTWHRERLFSWYKQKKSNWKITEQPTFRIISLLLRGKEKCFKRYILWQNEL